METPQEVVSKMIILINAEAEVSRMRADEAGQQVRR